MKIDILQFFVTGVTTLNQGHISCVYAHHLCAVSVVLFHVYTFGIFAVLRANVTSGFRPQPIAPGSVPDCDGPRKARNLHILNILVAVVSGLCI